MPRPASHRKQAPSQSCANCWFSGVHAPTQKLLCFHGEETVPWTTEFRPAYLLLTNGMAWWRMRVGRWEEDRREVGDTDVCDEWMAEQ
jgi:hypothetical protein